jgi:hypothetical protein
VVTQRRTSGETGLGEKYETPEPRDPLCTTLAACTAGARKGIPDVFIQVYPLPRPAPKPVPVPSPWPLPLSQAPALSDGLVGLLGRFAGLQKSVIRCPGGIRGRGGGGRQTWGRMGVGGKVTGGPERGGGLLAGSSGPMAFRIRNADSAPGVMYRSRSTFC